MKTKILIIIFICAVALAYGQKRPMPGAVDNPPFFNGDKTQPLYEFLASNIHYPAQSLKLFVEGTEVVEFVVNENGSLSDIKVIAGLSPEIDREVIRALRLTSGDWTPGMVNNKPFKMQHEISLVFKLSSSSDFIELARKKYAYGNKLLFEKDKPQKALKYFNRAYRYLPNEEPILASRSICKYLLGDKEGADSDFYRLKEIAERKGNSKEGIHLSESINSLLQQYNLTGISEK